jgi:putative spermidine/putrescine transport system permease protein
VFLFLIAPILVIIPLSFNVEPYFTFTEGMLAFDSKAYSTRWYADIVNNPQWLFSAKNSIFVAVCSTLIATVLGTLAALGLSQSHMPYKPVVMGVLISPVIVPLIISAAGIFFLFKTWTCANNARIDFSACSFRDTICGDYGDGYINGF